MKKNSAAAVKSTERKKSTRTLLTGWPGQRGRYGVDILTQVMAVQSALNSFNKALLASHIKSCVIESVRDGSDDKIDELVVTIQKLMK